MNLIVQKSTLARRECACICSQMNPLTSFFLVLFFLFFGVKEFPRCIPESTHVYVTSFQTSFTRTQEQYKVEAFTSSSLRDRPISLYYSLHLSSSLSFFPLLPILIFPFYIISLRPHPPTNYFLSFSFSPHYFFYFLSYALFFLDLLYFSYTQWPLFP